MQVLTQQVWEGPEMLRGIFHKLLVIPLLLIHESRLDWQDP